AVQLTAADRMIEVQQQLADKAVDLLCALDADRIENAPLNQLEGALGIIIDRFLKLQARETDSTTGEQVIRIEYYDASTGKVSSAPPWAIHHPEASGAVQASRLRQALRQDDAGIDYRNGKSHSRDADMVDRANISDGDPGLARFEAGDYGRDWYHY